jgi:hypothetical protein
MRIFDDCWEETEPEEMDLAEQNRLQRQKEQQKLVNQMVHYES